MLIANAEVGSKKRDVRLAGPAIQAIAPTLEPVLGEQVINARGGALLPGLHDHHIHLQATAAAMLSVRCGPPEVTDEEALSRALQDAPGTGWLRGVGYHHSVAGEIDRVWLDRHGPDRAIRIQHRGGRMWVCNSLAIEAMGFDVPADGRLVDRDRDVRSALASQRPDLGPLIGELLTRGVTGVTDTTPGNGCDDVTHLASHCGPLRLMAMGSADLHGFAAPGRVITGPLKLHYHDYDLPPLDALATEIADAHRHGRNAAMHCVTRAEIMLALAAFEQVGAKHGDRIEHAAIADPAIIEWTARLGLSVVTQPNFVTERADAYRADVEQEEQPYLWPLRSFADAGVPLAGGSDAPFGSTDPWRAMASAVSRPEGLGEAESVSPEQALALFTKPADDAGASPRKVAVGAPADLCLLDRSWAAACEDFTAVKVHATWVGGELAYDRISSTSPHSRAV